MSVQTIRRGFDTSPLRPAIRAHCIFCGDIGDWYPIDALGLTMSAEDELAHAEVCTRPS